LNVDEENEPMTVDVKLGDKLASGPPKLLFKIASALINGPSDYAVTRDGKRLLLRMSPPAGNSVESIYVVMNWPPLLRK